MLGLVESALYDAWAGLLHSALYNYLSNYLSRRADRNAEDRITSARAA